jgi:aminoglycoside phosphotransferase (APT) family kinase protein
MDHVRELVVTQMPGYPVRAVSRLDDGTDNVAYEVNGELIVRLAKNEAASQVSREARLLAAVAGICPLPVPEPAFVVPEVGCLGYRKLTGRPLLELPQQRRLALGPPVGAALGRVLTALHTTPVVGLADLVRVDDAPLADWRADAREHYAAVAGEVPAAHRRTVDAFLAAPPPEGSWSVVFSHNDLGIEHILVDTDGTLTGLLDWADAALVDPACDFGRIHRDLGPPALNAALRQYEPDVPGVPERAIYYARCMVFEDLGYGLETGRGSYVDKCLTALAWLFPV